MVVFTCNHCGESLQKPRVEKHYFTVCRKPKSLTCVDCFKDFKDEEFTVHTKCVTEEERYAAKGTFAEAIVKKGDVKQGSWTEMIRSIVDIEENMSPSLKRLFMIISTFTNVPRKRAKFINFLKSSSGGRVNLNDIEASWDLIEKYKTKTDSKSLPAAVKNGNDTKTDEPDGTADEPPKKNKKRSKSDKTDVVAQAEPNKPSENGDQDKIDAAEGEPPKKKKKSKSKKNKQNGNAESSEASNGVAIETESGTKIPENKTGDEVSKTSENGTSEKAEAIENKPKKQRKSKLVEEPINENGKQNEMATTDGEPPKKKKKASKSKKNKQNGVTPAINENQQPQENVEAGIKIGEIAGNQTDVQGDTSKPTSENGVSKKKKKSKLLAPIQNGSEPKVATADDEPPKEKKNGSNPQANNQNGNDDTSVSCNAANATPIENQQPQDTFSFKSAILSILRNKNSIPVKKLQKKVLGAYLKETGNSEYTDKIVKKYNQKLKKVSNVTIQNEIVTLLEC